MTRRLATWALILIGGALLATPFVLNMWVRAPRGAAMISDFKPYMTEARASLYNDDYLPTISLGFGSVPTALGDAARHYGGTGMTYDQAVTFLQGHPALSDLANIQQNFPTMAAPFTNMVSVMVRDVPGFDGVAGLPPFWLFPFFFALPGVILIGVGVILLRRERSRPAGGRAPQWTALVLGLGLVAAPFLPMPPGWVLMWRVAPPGAQVIADFGGPASGVPGSPPIMSNDTVTLFNGYLSTMQKGHDEIVPAIQAVAASQGRTISASEARDFIRSDVKVSQLSDIVDRFPTMYASFHGMLTVMARDVPDYEAVKALPPFTVFPFLFIIPGALVAAAGALILRSDAAAARRREDERSRFGVGAASMGGPKPRA